MSTIILVVIGFVVNNAVCGSIYPGLYQRSFQTGATVVSMAFPDNHEQSHTPVCLPTGCELPQILLEE